jgi:Raf kinase inhibitor-like YbhB/YbcL family protein
MKKLVSILFSVVLVSMLSMPVWADNPPAKDAFGNVGSFMKWNGPYSIKLQTPKQEISIQGNMENSRFMIPFKQVFSSAGAKVTGDKNAITALDSGKVITAKAGESRMRINNEEIQLDSINENRNGDLFVSLRAFIESYQPDIDWNANTRTLTIHLQSKTSSFKVASPAISLHQEIPAKYVHIDKQNQMDVNFPLKWSGAPKGTKAFAVAIYDFHAVPDSFLHWGIMNIAPSINQLAEGVSHTVKVPSGSYEPAPYFGPAPPPQSGDHYYKVVVYALDTDQLKNIKINKFPAYIEDFEQQIAGHILDRAVITYTYKLQ